MLYLCSGLSNTLPAGGFWDGKIVVAEKKNLVDR